MERLNLNLAAVSSQPSTEPSSEPNRKIVTLKCLKFLFSAYRPDQFADPEGFSVNAKMVLDQYPMETVEFVTDPRTGIQRRCTWPPSVKELVDACDEHVAGIKRRERYANWGKNNVDAFGNVIPQIEGTPAKRLTAAEMLAKYGKNYGIGDPDKPEKLPLTREEITSAWADTIKQYQSDPSLIKRLLNAKDA